MPSLSRIQRQTWLLASLKPPAHTHYKAEWPITAHYPYKWRCSNHRDAARANLQADHLPSQNSDHDMLDLPPPSFERKQCGKKVLNPDSLLAEPEICKPIVHNLVQGLPPYIWSKCHWVWVATPHDPKFIGMLRSPISIVSSRCTSRVQSRWQLQQSIYHCCHLH